MQYVKLGSTGQVTVQYLDADGTLLDTAGFDVEHAIEGFGTTAATTGKAFSVVLPWVAKTHTLELDFGKAAPNGHAVLLLNGWVDWPDGSTFRAASQEFKGGLVMPTIGCRIQMIRPGIHTKAHRHSAVSVYHVFRGQGASIVDGQRIEWAQGDFLTIPPFAWHEHLNESGEEAVLFSTTDAPVLEALCLYREDAYTKNGGRQVLQA